MNLVDTHAHLDFANDLDGWIARAKNDGVTKIITIGTSVEASKKCVEIAHPPSHKATGWQGNVPDIYATVGIHPEDGKDDIKKYGSLENCINELRKVWSLKVPTRRVVGVGECGLDYYELTSDKRQVTSDSEKDFQKELFQEQIKLASELKLPLVIHCRNAWEETFEFLSKFSPANAGSNNNLRGVFHSWTGDWEAAKRALDLGFYISFSGIVTFKNAPEVQEVAQKAPLNRILLETDSPFLSPEPLRGSPNEPKNVKIIAQFISSLRNLNFNEIAEVTSRNAERLFGI